MYSNIHVIFMSYPHRLPQATLGQGLNRTLCHNARDIMLHYHNGLTHVFQHLKIKKLTIVERISSTRLQVLYEMEASISPKANASAHTKELKTWSPFPKLAPLIAGVRVRFEIMSYLTMQGLKIAQEVQVIDSLALLSSILAKNRNLGPDAISIITQTIAHCREDAQDN